jgi:hypothetical protein
MGCNKSIGSLSLISLVMLRACIRRLRNILNAMAKSGTLWRHGMETACVEGLGELDSTAIVVPRPIVCKDFSSVTLKVSSLDLDRKDYCGSFLGVRLTQ